MTSSVDRLFESDTDVFLSNNFNEFQVRKTVSDESTPMLVAVDDSANFEICFEYKLYFYKQPQVLPSIDEIASINSKSPEPILSE